ncbi:winged helix-turn-helix domain-containing protein [Kitasatospora sp. NPDC087314]|uniref:winged helix-turn-helix domain-containing protein n=1 Tax=Kitasatospora sp. NPDC087314 TaxID=3364068 RepID=UPI00382B789D
MSSSSTATLPLPTATPHLRAVRSVPGVIPAGPGTAGAPGSSASPHSHGAPAAERWPGAPVRPSHAVPSRPAGAGVVPQPGALLPPAPQALLAALPEGATVVAALPQGALPQGLLAQYGTQFGGSTGSPMVGYLVLVPADSPVVAAAPAAVASGASTGSSLGGPSGVPGGAPAGVPGGVPAPVGVRPVRPAGRGIAVDTERRNAYVDGRLLDLTYLEFELLAHLTEHPQRVHTRDHLVSAVWGYGHVGDGRTVDVHVARLRRKLGPAYRDTIVTVRRVGYKYTPAS